MAGPARVGSDAVTLAYLASGLGAVAGLVLGLTGAGGGVLALPLLMFGLGLSIPQAAPIALLAVGLSALLGAVIGLRQRIVRYRAAALIGACGIATAPLGVWLSHRLPAVPLAACFVAVQTWVSVRLWRGADPSGRPLAQCPCRLDRSTGQLHWTTSCAQALAGTGALAGVLSGLLGVGGGFVIVPALRRYTDLEMNSVVATSLAVIALVALATGGATMASGVGNIQLALPFATGSAAGLLLGRRMAPRVSGAALQKVFAVTGFAAAMAILARSHVFG
ncbi:sulfite exporter TauE/SafE family protein [Pseudomonas japonica]|uniref:sulfite exporter TauE/SafE family protein n=1 Tax=Pseudomonas japonica TaxID=256466 RepID=UPI0015E3EB74|nr:sulfite exporter TauE/SafE family protein [Pseudomonas japonica]MBA1245218.1 sulfite exporter TauE/SafE family protein [Pseudomonas japonica]